MLYTVVYCGVFQFKYTISSSNLAQLVAQLQLVSPLGVWAFYQTKTAHKFAQLVAQLQFVSPLGVWAFNGGKMGQKRGSGTPTFNCATSRYGDRPNKVSYIARKKYHCLKLSKIDIFGSTTLTALVNFNNSILVLVVVRRSPYTRTKRSF